MKQTSPISTDSRTCDQLPFRRTITCTVSQTLRYIYPEASLLSWPSSPTFLRCHPKKTDVLQTSHPFLLPPQPRSSAEMEYQSLYIHPRKVARDPPQIQVPMLIGSPLSSLLVPNLHSSEIDSTSSDRSSKREDSGSSLKGC